MSQATQNGNLPSGKVSRTFRFGAFEADLHAGEVRKEGSRIKLQEQPFKILQILLENPGDIVSRDELQSRIWPEASYGDFDHAVNVAVGKLRTALGDSADCPAYIETVPRRGYRFVAPLETPPVLPAAADPAGEDSGVPPPRWTIKRGLWVSLGLIGCAVLVGLGFLAGRRGTHWQPPEIQRLTARRGTVYSARFTPDGRNVIYTATWDGAPLELFSADLRFQGSHSLGLTSTDLLAISSTGELAVLQDADSRFMLGMKGTLGHVPLAGGSPRPIAQDVDWADWTPDGQQLALVHDVAGKERLEFPIGHSLYETSGWISHIRFSPDGRRIAFLDHPYYDDDAGAVAVVDLAGHKTTLSHGWESVEGLAWAAGGKEIWFSATTVGLKRQIYAVDLSGHQRLSFRTPGGVTLQDIAPDGSVLMTSDEQRASVMGSARGAAAERDLSWRDWSLAADISRDGKTALLDEEGEQSGSTYTVAIRDLQGSPPIPLGDGVAGDLSPDGKWAASTVGYTQIVLLPTGPGTAKSMERGDIQHYEHAVHWTSDDKQIVFSANLPGHTHQCFIQSVDGGKPRPVTPEGVASCQVSPDGRWLAGADPDEQGYRMYGMDGGEPQPIQGILPGEQIRWTADPNFLYAYEPRKLPTKIYRVNIHTGQRLLFKTLTPPETPGLCGLRHLMFSADGQSYIYGYNRMLSDLYLVKGLR